MPANSQIHKDERIAVSLPVFNCAGTLRRAVESILHQTHSDLILVVVNDGGESPWHVLDDIVDARLIRFDLSENRGRYFADAVVLNATDAAFFAVQDADDWSEPNRLQSLLERLKATRAATAFSSLRQHAPGENDGWPVDYSRIHHALTPIFEHRVDHFGLCRSNHLREIGGCYGGFRIGYDTLLTNLLLMSGHVEFIDEPLYHRVVRSDSLTTSLATGHASQARRLVNRQLASLYRRAYGHFVAYRTGRIDRGELTRHFRLIRDTYVSEEAERQLHRESDRLRQRLPKRRPHSNGIARVVRSSTRDDWSIPPRDLVQLESSLAQSQPRRILEIGSGKSTLVLAKQMQRRGGRVVSLEHDPRFHAETTELLRNAEVQDTVDLRLANLQPTACVDGGVYPWYDVCPDGPFDFVLLDGPPQRHGRQAALFALAPHLAHRWEMWLHDANRAHEQSCLELWRQHFQFTTNTSADFVQLRGTVAVEDAPDRWASGLGISVLTGDRLPLLQTTLRSMERHYRSVLEKAFVVLMVNGDDRATEEFVSQLPYVNRTICHRESVLPIGIATSLLAQSLALNSNVRWLLHLEDDWEAMAGGATWLAEAARLLERDQNIGQVRLRHHGENVLTHHMISKRPIEWRQGDRMALSDHAHYTFNPSLIRAEHVPELFPCVSERDAQIQFTATSLGVAQLVPGIFRHIGGTDSRRLSLEPIRSVNRQTIPASR